MALDAATKQEQELFTKIDGAMHQYLREVRIKDPELYERISANRVAFGQYIREKGFEDLFASFLANQLVTAAEVNTSKEMGVAPQSGTVALSPAA